jgi:eukaryotic-like serine/threonine-protein kinase
MTSERWQQVETLFQAALARAPEMRAAFLAAACPADPGLQHEVEKLLASFESAGSFLETPAARNLGFVDQAGATTPSLQGGERLAHYEIVALLGTGGMGEVYLARDTKLDRQIALKLLPAQFAADPERVRRFEREARAASALNHPNIITIHEIGQADGQHFIATEYIAGETLRQRLSSGKLAPRAAVAITRQIASALVAAHQAGVVHRDIKPENVMVRPDGLVKVLDFGLAKPLGLRIADCGLRIESNSDNPQSAIRNPQFLTDSAVLLGTLAYLSPEQARREELDARTDIFSLGVVLYELLTGTRPFTGADQAALSAAILHSEPVPANLSDPALAQIVARALAKERQHRYQSAADLQAALEQFAQSRQSAPTPRWRIQATLAVAFALLALLVFGLWQLRWVAKTVRPSFNAAAAQKLTALPGQELFPSLAPDGQSVIFASRHQGNWDIYRQAVGARTATNLTAGSTSAELQPVYSPDGRQIAFRSWIQGGGIFVMNSDGSQVTQLSDSGFNPCWSPNGREVAFAEDNIWDFEWRTIHSRLWAVNVATHERRLVTNHDAVQPDWSPSGQRIAFWGEHKGGRRDIWTVAASGGEPIPVTDDEYIDWNPVWSPDGGHLYFLSNRGGEMNLWRVALDETKGELRGTPEPATLPAANCQHINIARHGSTLVYGQLTRSENLWQIAFDPATGQVSGAALPLTQGLKRYAQFALAPDEKSFVYLALGEPQQDLFIADLGGTPLRRLSDDATLDLMPRWAPDGGWIAFISDRSGQYEIWRVRPDGAELAQMTHGANKSHEVLALAWSPDGRQLFYQMRNGNICLIDAGRPSATQPPQLLPDQPPPGFIPWQWSPDGAYLAGWLSPTPKQQRRAIVVYARAQQRYEELTGLGEYPIWLNDNRRLLFQHSGEFYLLDRLGGKPQKIYALKPPNQIGSHALARDNRRLYFSEVSSEADIWLLKLE